MIKYALGCAEGHAFDSWFPDSAAYEKQRKRGFVVCPECGSTSVDKAIMAPAVVGGERGAMEAGPEIAVDDRRRKAREFFVRMRREIEANTDDVGARFPQVARAIHLGDEPERAQHAARQDLRHGTRLRADPANRGQPERERSVRQ